MALMLLVELVEVVEIVEWVDWRRAKVGKFLKADEFEDLLKT
jgi:hypothetical protein